ncbi:MAG: sulfotransferase family protein [Sediminimonas qiaohouensis]|uniref:Sulfotransferase family protein n=1 Tax=Sediminimonas qiaohouensis TaxID=552061 RepID=A0A7C9LL69_9RHOB|nr:sulfotransferase family 2 domain-containing protein [Sediminimonas qiaohouensis]MTJ03162.1 sulfotransferase family protein [Sediminimonas qiaohouensis]
MRQCVETNRKLPPQLRRNPIGKCIYFATKRIYKCLNIIPAPYKTKYFVNGYPVILIHNPKCGGTSLKTILGNSGTTHSMPRHVMRESKWLRTYSIVAARDPFDRFVSGYSFFVNGPYKGSLYNHYGDALKKMDAFTFFEFIKQHPENLGHQVDWATFPSSQKPQADLILKTELSEFWWETLKDHGITTSQNNLPKKNSSRKSGYSDADVLKISNSELKKLKSMVAEYYRRDYEFFGYPFPKT